MPDCPLFSAAQYEGICASLPDPTFILTESGRYAAILGGKDKRYYHDGSGLLGKYLSEVLSASKTQWFLARIHEALHSQKMLVVEYELSARDVLGLPQEGPAEPIWFEGRISALQQSYGGERAVIWVASNITDSKKMRVLLQQQAMTDELTGLHNRRFFSMDLGQAFEAFQRQREAAGVIYFDVDNFKVINDGLGHPAGDQALRDLASMLRGSAVQQHVMCRLGGDEFCIICRGQSHAQVMALAQQLLRHSHQVLRPYAAQGVQPSLSMGVAIFLPEDSSEQDIIRRADLGLYAAKAAGGNRVSGMAEAVAHSMA